MRADADINDDGKLYKKYTNKRTNAKKEGLECNLTYDDYCYLVRSAKITSSQIGFNTKDKFVLARYNDCGNYQLGNCRFITQKENACEKKISKKSSEASSHNIKNFMKNLSQETKLNIRKKIRETRHKKALIRQQHRREEFLKQANASYIGERNSQYGTCWIYKGAVNKKIKKEFLTDYLEAGWIKGRKL